MSEIGWSHLYSRFGSCRETIEENIRLAVREMFHEDHPDLLEGDYVEHSNAWIDYGFDDGPIYTLTVHRFGKLTLEKRMDQDDIEAIESFQLDNVTEDRCIQLCKSLVSGDLKFVIREFGKKD
jgi:hypothetical protein